MPDSGVIRVRRAPLCPNLPPEIWIRILSYHSDLTHLWLTCRAISSTFLAYTEQVFAEYVLRDTHIDWSLEKYNLGGKSRRPEVCVEFARFDEGKRKRVAYFKEKQNSGEAEGGKSSERYAKWRKKLGIPEKSVMERWEERIKSSKPEQPNYTIRIGDMVNDTALPGLAFGAQKREMGIEWRGMFRAFFREQDRFAVLTERRQKFIAENLQKVELGEALSAQDLHVPWPATEWQIRKQIRRARLREWYEDQSNEEMVWAVDSLKDYEGCRKEDGMVMKALGEIPGAGLGERWFGSTYWVQALHLDESDCLHRINVKVAQLRDHGNGNGNRNGNGSGNGNGNVKENEETARRLPQQRARSMSVASIITVS